MRYSIAFIATVLFAFGSAFSQVAKVEVKQANGSWTLSKNGIPYYIKGAGGQSQLEVLSQIGGNTIRTWSLDNAQKYLDAAHKNGHMVMMGLWVQHERHGFDYNDSIAVAKQLQYFTRKVKELKNHPALLMWGIGNEVDLFYSNTKVWDAVQDIAKMIHEEDPNHPTSTVTAGLDSLEVDLIMRKCPDIDIYGINTYGDLKNALVNVSKYGWNGPIMITEWGPNGHWEVEKTSWGAPIEQSSSQKAESYSIRYDHIANAKKQCLGSFVFLWGQKQETTATWYGVFSENGEATEVIDVLHKKWRNQAPTNSCPKIKSWELRDIDTDSVLKEHYLVSGKRYKAVAVFEDKDKDKLKLNWAVRSESTSTKSGGDAESAISSIPGTVKRKKGDSVVFVAPKREGAYRLFVDATDGNNHVAYTNIPFYVKPSTSKRAIQLKKRSLINKY